jgi:DNA-directed RNA polymerase subunit RPC12/RpoP
MSEYIRCPKCGEDELISAQPPERDLGVVIFETVCVACGFEFLETYEHISNRDTDGNELDDKGNPVTNITLEPVK